MGWRTGKTRREYPRHALVLQVEYPGRKGYLGDWTENVSSGGLFVRTDRPLSVGDAVTLDVSFPGLLDKVSVVGAVAWLRPENESQARGVGVRVDDDASRRRLAELALRASFGGADAARDTPFRVLIAEDNIHVNRMYRRGLKRLQVVARKTVDPVFAENGHTAALLLDDGERFDLIITDLYMPVMDGLQLLKHVRKHDKMGTIPVIVVTCGTADERELARQAGAAAFLQKPVQLGRLLETIACLLRR